MPKWYDKFIEIQETYPKTAGVVYGFVAGFAAGAKFL